MSRLRLYLFLCLSLWLPAWAAQAEPLNDLRAWDPAQGALHVLDGTWRLTWLEPARAEQEVPLPFTWKDGTRKPWGEVGFGRIELTSELLLPEYPEPLALYFDDFKSAARVWIDGSLAFERGQPGMPSTRCSACSRPSCRCLTMPGG